MLTRQRHLTITIPRAAGGILTDHDQDLLVLPM